MAGVAVGLTLGGTTAQAQDRAVNLVTSGTVDFQAGSVTLPLHMGRMGSGENVWYVLLDTSDRDTTARLGINWSGKLSNAGIGRAVREAEISPDGELVFDSGTVDFLPERRGQPGPDGAPFPPAVAMPDSVGDEDYSPLVRVTNAGGHIFNAPVVAFYVEGAALDRFCGGDPDHALVHDKVVRAALVPAASGDPAADYGPAVSPAAGGRERRADASAPVLLPGRQYRWLQSGVRPARLLLDPLRFSARKPARRYSRGDGGADRGVRRIVCRGDEADARAG